MTGLVSSWSLLEKRQNPVSHHKQTVHKEILCLFKKKKKKDVIRGAFGNEHIIYRRESLYPPKGNSHVLRWE